MMTFLFNEPEFLTFAMSGANPEDGIPQSLMDKMINFLLDDPYFSKEMLDGMEDQPGNEWMANLSD